VLLCELVHDALFLDFEVIDDHGDDAYDSAFRTLLPFTCINLGRHKTQAMMKPSETSASVHKPMKRPLWDTSASEMTGAILIVKTMRMADATQALCYH
jgi:hypothetical protein